MQSRFYCPSFAYCRFSLRDAGRGRPFRSLPQAGACTPLGNNLSPDCGQCRRRFRFTATVPLPPGCRKGSPPLPFSFAGGGVYPVRKQFVPRLQSMPSALPIYRRRFSSSEDAGRGRRPFRSLPQAGACTPLGNNLSPVCGQCRQRFRFTAAVPLPPGCRKGPPFPFLRGCWKGPPFLFLRGCRKRPPPLPLSSAGGGVYPARKQFVSHQQSMPSALPLHRRRSSSSGMPEGAAAPSALFRRRGRVPRRGAIFCLSGRSDLLSSSLPSVPKTSAEGKSLPIHKSPCSAMPSTDFYAFRQRGCFLFGEFSHRRKPATHTISGSVAIDRIVVAAKISDA